MLMMVGQCGWYWTTSFTDFYKANYEQETKEPYTWDDLDGKRPTMNEYREQEKRKCENMN